MLWFYASAKGTYSFFLAPSDGFEIILFEETPLPSFFSNAAPSGGFFFLFSPVV